MFQPLRPEVVFQPHEKDSLKVLDMLGSRFIVAYHANACERGKLHCELWDQDKIEVDVLFHSELFSICFAGISKPVKGKIRHPPNFVRALSNYSCFNWPPFRAWIDQRGVDYPMILHEIELVDYGRLLILRHLQQYQGIDRSARYAAHNLSGLTDEKSLPTATSDELAKEIPAARAHLESVIKRISPDEIASNAMLAGHLLPTFDEAGQLMMNDFSDGNTAFYIQTEVLRRRAQQWERYPLWPRGGSYGDHVIGKKMPYETLDYLLLLCDEYKWRYLR